MVSVKKVKQGFQLRRKGRIGGKSKEQLAMLAAGVCLGLLFVYVAFSDASSSEPRGVPESVRKTKSHPVLTEETDDASASDTTATVDGASSSHTISHPRKIKPVGDRFNAVEIGRAHV